jgi:hypothetical protein
MGIVATLSALVLGLLIASAKSSYDAQSAELTQMSAMVILLDRLLAHYGPETKESRDLLRASAVRILDQMWSKRPAGSSPLGVSSSGAEILLDKIDDTLGLGQERALPVILWRKFLPGCSMRRQAPRFPYRAGRAGFLAYRLTTIFISFGLFAPANVTVFAGLLVSALSVSAPILLILELYTPYSGLIQVSSATLRVALTQLAR